MGEINKIIKDLMVKITEGVEFTNVAREWRCKWSADNDKASLAAAQKVLDYYKDTIKGIPGVKNVQRVVCGSCLDFKVITCLNLEAFGIWEGKAFAPETEFLDKLRAIEGISNVETQTFTLETI